MIDAGIIIFLTLFIVFFCVIPLCCRKRRHLRQLEIANINRVEEVVVNGQRMLRVATVSRNRGQVSLDVYEIRVTAHPPGGTSALPSYEETPPPPFQTALEVSTPVIHPSDTELPPPTYEDFMKVHVSKNCIENTDSNNGINTGNISENNSAIDSSSNTTPRY